MYNQNKKDGFLRNTQKPSFMFLLKCEFYLHHLYYTIQCFICCTVFVNQANHKGFFVFWRNEIGNKHML